MTLDHSSSRTTGRNARRGARLAACLLALAAIAVVLPGAALARIVQPDAQPGINSPGGITFGGTNADNRVGFGTSGVFYFVEDQNATAGNPVFGFAPCTDSRQGVSPTFAICPQTVNGRTVTSYEFHLNGGNDSLFNRTFLEPLTNGFASGGAGNDGLNTGSARTNDRLFGSDGDDNLTSGGGFDILRGGPGNDNIFAVDSPDARGADRIICDEGRDSATVDLLDQFPSFAACEFVQQAPIDEHPLVEILGKKAKVSGGRAAFKLKCPEEAADKCRGKLRIKPGRKGGGKVGSSRYSLKKGSKKKVRVKVGGKRGTVRAVASEPDDQTTTAQLKLR